MSLSKAEHDELCCVYAGLLLFDSGVEISADKLNKVITASGNQVESYYPDFFAKYFKSVDLDKLLQNVGTGGAPAVSSGAPVQATTAPAEAKKEEKKDDKKGGDKKDDKKGGAPAKKEEKKKPEPEEEEDGPLGLF